MVENFYKDIGKIIGFLIGIMLLNSIAGQRATITILVLIMLGQLITHPDILSKIPFFGGKTNE
jgi:hypothetical protein